MIGGPVQGLAAETLRAINSRIADRSTVFYWQTDRGITPQQTSLIWSDRHRFLSDHVILSSVNRALGGTHVDHLLPYNPDAQTSLGNVNSVRIGVLEDDTEIIIRCHPVGILNGYFHVEALAAQVAIDAGLPSYRTLAIHDLEGVGDVAFQVCEKLPGTAVRKWLQIHPEDEPTLLQQIGKTLSILHNIRMEGFGPFDNQLARRGKLSGLHSTWEEAVSSSLADNLVVLEQKEVLNERQSGQIRDLFTPDNPLLRCEHAVLVHNDFADWNLLTDGQRLSGITDWDECIAGDPVADLACWSTFFAPERMGEVIKSYREETPQSTDFEERFELLRLRYIVSKMTLRLRRFGWQPSDMVRELIENGKKHLAASLDHFGIR